MSRALVTFPRVENLVVDFLVSEDFDAAARLPENWTTASAPVVVVSVDPTPAQDIAAPVAITPTVRLVAWSESPTDSHDLVMAAAGLMEAHDGHQFTARLNTGPLQAIDPDHGNAALCAVTLKVRVRSIPLDSSPS